MNPALCGSSQYDFRFGGVYRKQWKEVSLPYKTFTFGLDTKKDNLLKNSNLGLGLLLNTDKAGDSELGTTQLAIPLAFHYCFNKKTNFVLSGGLIAGIAWFGFHSEKLIFDNQYYNNPNTTFFSSDKTHYFDLGAGMTVNYSFFSFGAALNHINRPQTSFFEDKSSTISPKLTIHSQATFEINKQLKLEPIFLYQKQNSLQEMETGVEFLFPIRYKNCSSFQTGIFYRWNDALILEGGMQIGNICYSISYDINTSGLNTASNYKGGFEISLLYVFNKAKILPAPHKYCPSFL